MSMSPVLGEVIIVGMITSGLDGASIDADAVPTCAVFEDAADTPIAYTPTVVKRGSNTGTYRSSVDCSTTNGFEVGKTYEVIGKATVGGKTSSAILERFQIRGYSTDGVNVLKVAGQTATIAPPGSVPGDPMTLTPQALTDVAASVKTNVGNDTTTGSMGKQVKDMAATMSLYGGDRITGKVTTANTVSNFTVTLDTALDPAKPIAGIIGQYLTVRSGGAQTEAQPITGCVISSPTVLVLSFTAPNVFSVAPQVNAPISISE